MKRIIAILLIFLLLSLCGCAANSNEGSPETLAQSPETPPADASTNSDMPENMPADGFSANSRVIGRVESIVGNEVVLELGETGDEMQFRTFDAPNGEMPDGEMPERPSGEPNMRRGDGQGQITRTPPPGMTPEEGMGRRDFNEQEGQGGRAPSFDFDITYTGETATYLLPVGMQIGTGDYTTVKAGMVLLLVLDEDGAITRVSILSQ